MSDQSDSPTAARSGPVVPGPAAELPEIWMVNHYAITPDLPGGTRHYDLATELMQRGFRVRIFASDVNLSLRKHTKLEPGHLFATEERNGVEFVWVQASIYEVNNWRRTWNMVSFAVNFLRVALRLGRKSRPAIIVGSSPHLFAALAGELAARWLNSHFVLELRDLWPQALIDMGGVSETQPTVRLLRLLERYLYRRAEKVIILARGSSDYLVARGVNAERILFLPNGVHLGHFQPSMPRDAAREKYGFDRFTLVYAGAHGPANALDTIIQAADRLRDIPLEFVLIGDGPSRNELLQLAKETGATNVRLLPPVPKDEIPDILNAADAGVITLRNVKAFGYGVSPNKLFDYMAAARPVLCSAPGDMADMVSDAQAGLSCAPEDPEQLAAAARSLFAMSPTEREKLGSNGKEYLRLHFSREVLAGVLADTLREVAAAGTKSFP